MTLDEARRVLGLGPDEDPATHLVEFRAAREKIAELVRTAPTDALAERYQEGLVEFDKALAAVREHLEALEKKAEKPVADAPAVFIPPPVPEPVSAKIPEVAEVEPVAVKPPPVEAPEKPVKAVEPEPVAVKSEEPVKAVKSDHSAPVLPDRIPVTRRKKGAGGLIVWLVLLLAVLGAGYAYLLREEDKRLKLKAEIATLEGEGAALLDARRWAEAREFYDKIEALLPGSEVAAEGRAKVEAGFEDEHRQFLGYWNGEALAALESDRLDAAEAAVAQVLSKFPTNAEAEELKSRIAEARAAERLKHALEDVRKKIEAKQWDAAIVAAETVTKDHPADKAAGELLQEAKAGKTKAEADRVKALDLFSKARERDKGAFDDQALGLLRQATLLAPDNAEIKALFDKMSSYIRTLQVPGDYATPVEALAAARDRDRIVIAEGTWVGPLLVDKVLELQGAGSGKTIIECPAGDSAVLSVGPDAKEARFTGLTFRHQLFDAGTERFPAALVRGGSAIFADCRFVDASGHGLAVLEKGKAEASRCVFTGNGWDGASAKGAGTTLDLKECEASGNFEHGIDLWDGAGGTLSGNRCEHNSRNGIQVDSSTGSVNVLANQLGGNREFGLVLASGTAGKVADNVIEANQLGGLVVRASAVGLAVTGNRCRANLGPSLILEKPLPLDRYRANVADPDISKAVRVGLDFEAKDEAAPVAIPVQEDR